MRDLFSASTSGNRRWLPLLAAGLLTALLPGALGVNERVIYVCTAVTISAVFFLVLRGHVFHAAAERSPEPS